MREGFRCIAGRDFNAPVAVEAKPRDANCPRLEFGIITVGRVFFPHLGCRQRSGSRFERMFRIELDFFKFGPPAPARWQAARSEDMPMEYTPGRMTFGLLPEPEGRSAGFIASSIINATVLGVVLLVGVTARQVITRHYEMTELIVPTTPPPQIKIKQPPLPKMPPPPEQPKLEIHLQPKQIQMPKPVVEPKPVQMEAKVNLPVIQAKAQQVRPVADAQSGAGCGNACAKQFSQAVDCAGAPGRDLWRHAESQRHAACDDRGHRQSLRWDAGAGSCAAWSRWFNRNWQRLEIRFECRRGGESCVGGNSGSDGYEQYRQLRQSRFGWNSGDDPGSRGAEAGVGSCAINGSGSRFEAARGVHERGEAVARPG